MVNEKELLRDLQISDLQEQHQEFAEVIGMDNLIRLSEYFGGTSIYVPQKRELVKLKKYELIRKEYNGSNIKELANKYDLSERTVYSILHDMLMGTAAKREAKVNIPGQQSILDWKPETIPQSQAAAQVID